MGQKQQKSNSKLQNQMRTTTRHICVWGGGGLTKIGVDLCIVQNHFSRPYFEPILYTFGQHRFSGLDARDGYGDNILYTDIF